MVDRTGSPALTEEKPSLLHQLRINRVPKPKRKTPNLFWAVGLALFIITSLAAFWWWQNYDSGTPVHAAYARAVIIGGDSAQGAPILDASGYIIPHRQATVASQIAGRVISLPVEEGEQVVAGQVLARLDDRDQQAARLQALAGIDQSQSLVAQAETALADATPIFGRDRDQLARGLISAEAFETEQADYDTKRTNVTVQKAALIDAQANLAAANTALSETIITSPFAGVVTETNVQVGEIISPFGTGSFTRSGIVTLVDMTSLEAQVDVSEIYIDRISRGQGVAITLNAYPAWQIPGKVIAVIPTADETTATVKVRIALGLRDPRILPQMGLQASFLGAGPAGSAIGAGAVVESDAVLGSGDTGTVFVIDDGHLKARRVQLGAVNGNDQVILKGLAPGERVVIGDLAHLSDGMRIRVTN
jgi:RND family efflux transporter MFP subunit